MSTLINLTPHDLTIYFGDPRDPATVVAVWKSAGVARVEEVTGESAGVSVDMQEPYGGTCVVESVTKSYGSIEGLPDSSVGIIFVVSLVVLQALRGSRQDVYAPDSGPESAVRDAQGKILGVRRLMQLAGR